MRSQTPLRRCKNSFGCLKKQYEVSCRTARPSPHDNKTGKTPWSRTGLPDRKQDTRRSRLYPRKKCPTEKARFSRGAFLYFPPSGGSLCVIRRRMAARIREQPFGSLGRGPLRRVSGPRRPRRFCISRVSIDDQRQFPAVRKEVTNQATRLAVQDARTLSRSPAVMESMRTGVSVRSLINVGAHLEAVLKVASMPM